ncbi:MAG: dihydrofolate reductase [Nonomuraea sp.]|nr:dihydrofolate reductase [Nonomuraea sp.]
MAKLVVSQFMSVDGYVGDPGGSEGSNRGGWAFRFDRGQDGDRFKFDEVMAAEALLLGRVTYEGFAAAWPGRTDDVGFADKFNGMAKFVVSSTMGKAEWNNSTILPSVDAVPAIKAGLTGDLLVNGSATLVAALADRNLVDEYRLMVFPTLLGEGPRLFSGSASAHALRLTGTRPVGPDGVVVLTYEPA